MPTACEYRAVVFATFPDQHGQIAEQLANKCPGQKLVFVVHNSQELLRNGALPAPLCSRALCSACGQSRTEAGAWAQTTRTCWAC